MQDEQGRTSLPEEPAFVIPGIEVLAVAARVFGGLQREFEQAQA
jgi:hypothetical protein